MTPAAAVRRAGPALLVLALPILVLAATGCGIAPQEHPAPVAVARQAEAGDPAPVETGALQVPVYFARGSGLQPVTRSAAEVSTQTALDLLVTGPSRRETTAGVRTALAPQPLAVLPPDAASPGTAVVAAGSELASVSGPNQLLGVAQVVWTLTELPGVTRVRITVDGVPVEVPTDDGLTREPVTRSDYRSVSPPAQAPPAAAGAAGALGGPRPGIVTGTSPAGGPR